MNRKFIELSYVLLLLGFLLLSILVLSQDDLNLKDPTADGASDSDPNDSDFDDFMDSEVKPDYELDPGSWSPIFEPANTNNSPYFNFSSSSSDEDAETNNGDNFYLIYYLGVKKMVTAASRGDGRGMAEAATEIEAAAAAGHSHSLSVMGFLYGMGIMRERSKAKAFLHHYFAAEGGNLQSKMALAYTYYRQDMHEKAVTLYAELAEIAVNSFLISKDSPVIEPVRIHSGAEENKEALRKSRGEEDEDFQILGSRFRKRARLYPCIAVFPFRAAKRLLIGNFVG